MKFLKRRWLVALIGLLATSTANSQSIHTLEDCLKATDTWLPLAAQRPLIQAANDAAIAQLRSNYLPQASLNGQATWQSEVTSLPIKLPNVEVPTISKDQYRFTLEIVQPIWDGGQVSRQTDVQQAQTQVEQQRIEQERFAAREQTVQLYCAALLAHKQTQTITTTRADLRARRARVQEQVNNGTAIQAHILAFDARLLELDQMEDDILAKYQSALEGLKMLTGLSIGAKDSLARPSGLTQITGVTERPELTLFALQQASTSAQEKVLNTRLMPKFNAIATLGYARPGLNFLSNEFQPYAIFGANFRWNLGGFYNGAIQKEKQLLRIQNDRIGKQREQFLVQNGIRQKQQDLETERLKKMLERDQNIIQIRDQVVVTAGVQLENGVLTPSEFLIESANATNARINAAVHEIQLIQAQLLQQFIHP